jgi:hypothetical protein
MWCDYFSCVGILFLIKLDFFVALNIWDDDSIGRAVSVVGANQQSLEDIVTYSPQRECA